ncbi:hypothetical protein PGB90_009899 [Kerria lacca]
MMPNREGCRTEEQDVVDRNCETIAYWAVGGQETEQKIRLGKAGMTMTEARKDNFLSFRGTIGRLPFRKDKFEREKFQGGLEGPALLPLPKGEVTQKDLTI